MKLGHLEIFVADPVSSRDWYVRAVGATEVADQGQFQWVAIGDAEILFRPGEPNPASAYRGATLAPVLYVDSLDDLRAHLESLGVEVTHGDEDGCLTFQDPDGHWLQATVAP